MNTQANLEDVMLSWIYRDAKKLYIQLGEPGKLIGILSSLETHQSYDISKIVESEQYITLNDTVKDYELCLKQVRNSSTQSMRTQWKEVGVFLKQKVETLENQLFQYMEQLMENNF